MHIKPSGRIADALFQSSHFVCFCSLRTHQIVLEINRRKYNFHSTTSWIYHKSILSMCPNRSNISISILKTNVMYSLVNLNNGGLTVGHGGSLMGEYKLGELSPQQEYMLVAFGLIRLSCQT